MSGKNHAQKAKMWALACLLVCVSVLWISLYSLDASDPLREKAQPSASFVEDNSVGALAVVQWPLQALTALSANVRSHRDLREENAALRVENSRLQSLENKFLDMEVRTSRLRVLLNQQSVLSDEKALSSFNALPAVRKILARSVSEHYGPFVHSALLTAGRAHGVKKGYAVLNADYLIGHIVRVGKRSARALLLTDLNSKIAVMNQRTSARAILRGRNMELPQLDFIVNFENWKIGDRIVSSGDSGFLPMGLAIGEVVAIANSSKTKDYKTDARSAFDVQTTHLGVRLYSAGLPVDWVWVLPYGHALSPDGEGFEKTESLQEIQRTLP